MRPAASAPRRADGAALASSATETWLLWAAALFYLALCAAKLAVAAHLDLFYDEATYWQASLRPAFGYTHAAPATPFLIRIGTWLFGDTPLGVRSIHLMLAAALPFAVYALGRQTVGRRDALLAAAATLVMPLSALQGEAYMDAPLLLLSALALAAFARAVATGATGPWIGCGLACALGLTVHYRFVPLLLGLLAFLVLTRPGRACWRQRGLWIAVAIAAVGALPLAIFNLRTGFAGFQYQVLDRNPWAFQLKGLRFPLEQLLVVTPVLFAALAGAAADGIARARRGDGGRALLVIAALVYVGFYLVLAPFSDLEHIHAHWPAAGYLPLLVLLPGALRGFVMAGRDAGSRRVRAALCLSAPATGALAVAGAMAYLAASAWPAAPFPDSLNRIVRNDLIAWSRLGDAVARAAERRFGARAGTVVFASRSYFAASGLDFALRPASGVYVLDHPVNRRGGLWPQYVLWSLDEDSLRREHAGAPAIIVVEDTEFWFEQPEEVAWRRGLCSVFGDIEPVGDLEQPNARAYFIILAGTVRAEGARAGPVPAHCPALTSTYLARPKRGAGLRGIVEVVGFARAERTGVAAVELVIDGAVAARLPYGISWDLVGARLPGSSDPNRSNVRFDYAWDTTTVADGPHRLDIRTVLGDGTAGSFGRRTVFIDNR